MKRILFSDNGTLTDISTNIVDYHQGTAVINYTLTEDAIYIGSELPFNSLYFKPSVVNTAAATPTISYWAGDEWVSMVDVLDETSLAGATLGQSGHITWTPDKTEKWQREDTVDTQGNESVTGLGNVTIYDLFWLKVTFSATLDVTTALSYVGVKFCSDSDLTGEHVLFGNTTFKSNYESGKTSWEREIVLASRLIVSDIIKKQAIWSGDQLLNRRIFIDACVSKTAELIFSALGDDYTDDRDNARSEYKSRLALPNFSVDTNSNAVMDRHERMGVKRGDLYR